MADRPVCIVDDPAADRRGIGRGGEPKRADDEETEKAQGLILVA
ncbi:MAG TPA: hypothetical protein VIV58_17610 [Kofleriaceae bacterium]